ncbi:metalloprotease PmbA [Neisseria animalis]|uniref:Metalloprotease PmbA n=1 Tax=Neisseria animalis TaxID=492 RepID=A0A5P3MU50_NEIAN|nr:metalloprotease PmbA [Neisseria animalis]QEY24585.1 metalloprotease PmbA [Neisseria animalis]ROW33001.1 metalloprotease PmbA [Neisseria animalis]VEE07423.1 PmbA protein [Neisseria animalis]
MLFNHTQNELIQLCADTLSLAEQYGATAAEADFSESLGQSVSVRLNEIEQIEFQQDKSLDITVYVGQRKGRASTADFSAQALSDTVKAAIDIARYTAEDECAGLADAELMARHITDFDRYHEWDLSAEQAVEMAKACEQAALDTDKRIGNSEGAGVHTGHYQYVYGNSHGFMAHQQGTRHSISCSVVAADGQGMQRDYWYDTSCRHPDIDRPESIGRTAAERALRRLSSRSIPTGTYPVLFDTTISGGLIGHLVGALSGGALYRQSSFLINSIGKTILPEFANLREEPHIPRAFGSTCFDSEGVATQPRFVIRNGVVEGYFLSSYSARKLGMTTTANAGGAHNLYLDSTHPDQTALLKEMGSGLLVTELMGQGVNTITGDYSRGAAGFWVENGIIAYPVHEITIAGRLQDMYRNIAGIADDALRRSSNKIGSILVSQMTVAGS